MTPPPPPRRLPPKDSASLTAGSSRMMMSRDRSRRRPHRPRRRRGSLLCCLLLPSSVSALRAPTTQGATTTSSALRDSRDSLPREHHTDTSSSCPPQSHGPLSRIRQCPELGYLMLRGGGGESDDGESILVGGNNKGGASSPPTLKSIKQDDDDEKIDAYIEQLIASVEDEAAGDNRFGGGEQEGSDDGEADSQASQETKEIISGTAEPVIDQDNATVSVSSDEEAEDEASDVVPKEPLIAVSAHSVAPESPTTRGTSEATAASEVQSSPILHPPAHKSSPLRVRPPPPNPVYRALLRRRGWGGHVVAMALVTVSEFCDLWLPLLVRVWDSLVWRRLVGDPSQMLDDGGGGGNGEGRRRRPRRPPVSAQELESKVRSSKRSGTNRKYLQELQRQADQAALQVLRQLKKDSKYRFTSLAFQRRHGLGQFAAAASSRERQPTMSDPSSTVARPSSSGSKVTARTSGGQEGNDEDEDVDWILDALTTANDEDLVDTAPASGRSASTSKNKAAVQPHVALEVGPNGPAVSVGVEFSLGGSGSSGTKRSRRTSSSLESVIRSASAKHRSARSATSRVVTSDRDSGVLGRIRAAASDGIGRSLLGAYPGDAAPISEAANPRGVLDLASRYGYGDWSELDDDDDDDDNEEDEHDREPASHKTRRRTRRKRSSTSRPVRARSPNKSRNPVDFGIDFSPSQGSGSSRDLTKGATSPSRVPSPHSSSLPTPPPRLERRSGGVTSGRSSSASRRTEPVRRAMDRTNDAKRIRVPETVRGAPIRPAMERVNERRRRMSPLLEDDEG